MIHNYIQLAAAIVNSGIRQHDIFFLESSWCDFLIQVVIDYNKHNNNKSMPIVLDKINQ